jgi:hypothetical protein
MDKSFLNFLPEVDYTFYKRLNEALDVGSMIDSTKIKTGKGVHRPDGPIEYTQMEADTSMASADVSGLTPDELLSKKDLDSQLQETE